jgi:hypothetical protein
MAKIELLNATLGKEIPKDWNTEIIMPMFKKGDPKSCTNYTVQVYLAKSLPE